MPILAVSFAVIYALVAVGVMLYYTAYAMRSLQPTFLIDSAAHETVDVLRARVSGLRSIAHVSSATEQSQIVGEPLVLNVETPGFVQRIQVRELMQSRVKTISWFASITRLGSMPCGRADRERVACGIVFSPSPNRAA